MAAAVGIGFLAVHEIGVRARARAGGAQVLAPEQEFDGVPAGGDVFLAVLLVQFGQRLGRDGLLAVVDDAGLGIALHIVHVGLVHGPGIDPAFGSVLVVDGAVVKAESFGLAVDIARLQPGLARRGQRLGAGLGQQPRDGLLHGLGRCQRVAVARIHEIGVMAGDLIDREDGLLRGGDGRGRDGLRQGGADRKG
ncbi:hypothetical protein D3C78_1026350 [compost metagenome]